MSAHGHSREGVLVEERVGLLARSEAEVAAAEAAAAERALGAQHAFRQLFRRHPAGVAVVTLVDPILHLPVGFTATSVISVSADPPTLAFSISRGSSSWPALYAAESVVVNFLRAGAEDVSSRFATHGIDRFADVDFARLDTGRLGYPVEQIVDLIKWLLAKTRKDLLLAIEGGGSPEDVREAYLREWAFFCSVLAGGIYRPSAPA